MSKALHGEALATARGHQRKPTRHGKAPPLVRPAKPKPLRPLGLFPNLRQGLRSYLGWQRTNLRESGQYGSMSPVDSALGGGGKSSSVPSSWHGARHWGHGEAQATGPCPVPLGQLRFLASLAGSRDFWLRIAWLCGCVAEVDQVSTWASPGPTAGGAGASRAAPHVGPWCSRGQAGWVRPAMEPDCATAHCPSWTWIC